MVLTHRQGRFVFALLMCIAISGAISFVMNFLNLGFDHSLGFFIARWLKAWVIGLFVAIVVALFVAPIMRKFVDSLSS